MKQNILTKTAAYLLAAGSCLLLTNAKANNVQILNVGVNATATTLTCTISWDNSWRVNQPPYSWDAVWVFVKYSDCVAVPTWTHATLSTIAADHFTSNPGLLEVATVTDGMGVFVKRSVVGGPGAIATTTVSLTLTIPSGTYNFRVYGVEMVYIPPGDFQIGDGASSNTFASVTVNSTLEMVGAANAFTAIGGTGTTTNPLPAAYPVGWVSFYCMKYEISQQQWVDFLNTLTYDQQATHTITAPSNAVGTYAMAAAGANRNGIRIATPGIASTQPAEYACDLDGNLSWNGPLDGQNIAANYLSWGDLSAYLDWAALRPMTELEYEKVCRGTVARVANELPCGIVGGWPSSLGGCCTTPCYTSTTVLATTTGSSFLTNAAANNEISSVTGNGLLAGGGAPYGIGSLRVGFAATGGTTRITACAGFYGVLDLGGNVWERTVSTNADGISFTGILGNGALTAAGNADVVNWPTAAAALGTGRRGGAWNSTATGGALATQNIVTPVLCAWQTATLYALSETRTSDRSFAATVDVTRTSSYGGRGAR